MNKIKVYHLEDYRIIRDGIKFMLSQDDEIEVVGSGEKGDDLFVDLHHLAVDVVVLDLYLDRMKDVSTIDGFVTCERLQASHPDIRIVAHSMYDDASRIQRILKAGALAFVSKKSGIGELISGIKAAARGEQYICAETTGKLKNLSKFLAGIEDTLKGTGDIFSVREREVLELLASGYSSKEIAEKLNITERTVESHRKNMIEKSQAKNTVGLISYASSLGLIKQ